MPDELLFRLDVCMRQKVGDDAGVILILGAYGLCPKSIVEGPVEARVDSEASKQ